MFKMHETRFNTLVYRFNVPIESRDHDGKSYQILSLSYFLSIDSYNLLFKSKFMFSIFFVEFLNFSR